MNRTALIVGAGIGGLSAAIALRRAGWRVRIVERTASPRELGFGVALAPNAIAALGELGVAGTVLTRAFVPRRGELRRPDGTVVKRAELPPDALGGPMVMALRPALHGALVEAVGLDAITLSTEVTGFTCDARGVTLLVRNGSEGSVSGDLLVGADGIRSAIRRQLHPSEPPPRACGIVAVRGAVHGAVHHLGELSAVYYLGPGIESMLVRASETGIYWFLSVARDLAPDGTNEATALLAHLAPRFDATFRAVTSMTEDLRFDELVDRDPLPFWGRGAVTLLGDAAHPVLPHTGQGAAQAIVDAVTLGQTLTRTEDVEAALGAYENERRMKTARLLSQGRRTARFMRITNPVACAMREGLLRMLPVKTFAKLYVRINRRAGTDVGRGAP